jgi:glycosyltransferase involved in cell wall biosynthesis
VRIALVSTGLDERVRESARELERRHEVTVFSDCRRGIAADIEAGDFDRVVSFGVECAVGDAVWANGVDGADAYHRYCHLFAASDVVAGDLALLYGVPRSDVEVVPNGFSPEEFSPGRRIALRAGARRQLGLHDDDLALLTTAGGEADVLLDAVARLRDPRVRVLGGGDGAAADVFVLPTRHAVTDAAVVEALASGLPAIVSDVPGAGDHVIDGVNGLIQHDPLDSRELASLLRTTRDPRRRATWSAAAPGSVEALQWPRIVGRLEQLLDADDWRLAA